MQNSNPGRLASPQLHEKPYQMSYTQFATTQLFCSACFLYLSNVRVEIIMHVCLSLTLPSGLQYAKEYFIYCCPYMWSIDLVCMYMIPEWLLLGGGSFEDEHGHIRQVCSDDKHHLEIP
jgi:hypothetical protein